MDNTACNVCASKASWYKKITLLGKYDVDYFRCDNCQFIFSEKPYWLDEAYSSAITKLDIGLVQRNEITSNIVSAVIKYWFDIKGKFIDYGGGYGLFVRMMRDRGFDYYRQDIHCINLFAQSFDISDLSSFKGELLTAFEVFEHLEDPLGEVNRMLELSDNILFSTTLQPCQDVTPESWWYFTPETGQHIALYSEKTLSALASRYNLHYYRGAKEIHLFTKQPISNKLFKLISHPRLSNLYNILVPNPKTLLQSDFKTIQSKLSNSLSQKIL